MYESTKIQRTGWIVGAVSLSIMMVVLLALLSRGVAAGQGKTPLIEFSAVDQPIDHPSPKAASADDSTSQGFVYRFDPALESFETFTIPTDGARPHSVGVVSNPSHLDIWFTEPGTDQIGRLVYTATNGYTFYEYPLEHGSRPLDLVVDENRGMVWFTEQMRNRIGRLEIGDSGTVSYASFDVYTPNSQPAGIDLAPNGSVWFTEMAADKIGRLVMTSTTDYSITEYIITGTGTNVGAYGIAVQSDRYVWVGETRTGIVRRLSESGSYIWVSGLGTDGYPYDLIWDARESYVWLTERDDNQIGQFGLGTNFFPNQYSITPTRNFRPTGLTMVGRNQFWFSGQGSGQIGNMVFTSPVEYSFEFHELPLGGFWAMDIASDQRGNLWTVGYLPRRVFLPSMIKSQ